MESKKVRNFMLMGMIVMSTAVLTIHIWAPYVF